MAKIKVTMKELLNGRVAMKAIITRPMIGKVSYRVNKAVKKALAEIETYDEGMVAIIKAHGGKPTPAGGTILAETSDNFDDAMALVDKHRDKSLKEVVEIDGVVTIKVDEFIEALPEVPELKDADGNVITPRIPKGTIEPFILMGLDWLIEE